MLKQSAFSTRVLLVLGTALVMAFLSAKYLFSGSILNVLPWGILALLTSLLAVNRREAWKLGGIFGFAVSYGFLWFDNTDIKSLSQVLFLMALVILPSLFGFLCGALAAWLGWILRKRLTNKKA